MPCQRAGRRGDRLRFDIVELGGEYVRSPLVADPTALRRTSTPVLAVTEQAMRGDRQRFLAAGFDGYLSKPVDVIELIRTMQHFDRRA